MLTPRLDLAEAASLAYDDPNFFASNIQARILVRNGVTQIAIAGSNDAKDWFQDFQAVLVERAGRGKLFEGFATMGDESKAAFLQRIISYPAPYEFSAHSAGCAVALQWAAWLAELKRDVGMVQILAAPTVGNAQWAEYYKAFNIPTLRIGTLHDPVAALPGETLGGVYECEMLVLDQDGHSYSKQDLVPNIRIVEVAEQVKQNHPIGNYLRGIRCYLQAG